MSVVDSHVHLWDPDRLNYPWLEGFQPLRHKRDKQDYMRAVSEAHVDSEGFFAVQADAIADQSDAEVDLISGFAGKVPILGVVAYASLECGLAEEEHLSSLASDPRVVGVRRAIQNSPEGLVTSSRFLDGMITAASLGLTIDLCARDFQLPELLQAVNYVSERVPSARFALDHAGKPPVGVRNSSRLDNWIDNIQSLATIAQVTCKISGFVTELEPGEDLRRVLPAIEIVLDSFGANRCMFGTDWPVVELACPTASWVGLAQEATQNLSEQKYAQVWHGTAVEFYHTTK